MGLVRRFVILCKKLILFRQKIGKGTDLWWINEFSLLSCVDITFFFTNGKSNEEMRMCSKFKKEGNI